MAPPRQHACFTTMSGDAEIGLAVAAIRAIRSLGRINNHGGSSAALRNSAPTRRSRALCHGGSVGCRSLSAADKARLVCRQCADSDGRPPA
jgi:hypothetical protein